LHSLSGRNATPDESKDIKIGGSNERPTPEERSLKTFAIYEEERDI